VVVEDVEITKPDLEDVFLDVMSQQSSGPVQEVVL
jgi:hypothetical protein